jgi:hypothetical protein
MLKTSNTYIRRKPIHYTQLINVWVDETKKLETIKRLMIGSRHFNLEKLKYNPVYKETYDVITKEKDTELEKLDKSLVWSRRYQKKDFYNFVFPFSLYSFVLIPYIFYKVLQKRILEQHVKNEYNAENLTPFNYWNLDFKNKDIYPDSVIKLYFDIKKVKYQKELKEEKHKKYNEEFAKNITNGYINDLISRRQFLGYNDDED